MRNGKNRKHVPGRLTVTTGTVDDFFRRVREHARKLDRGEKLIPEFRLTFEDPADLLRVLSAERVRLLRAVRANPAPVTALAAGLKRDRKSVRRDVGILESYGLLTAREEPNPGHGRRRIILPVAATYHLSATI